MGTAQSTKRKEWMHDTLHSRFEDLENDEVSMIIASLPELVEIYEEMPDPLSRGNRCKVCIDISRKFVNLGSGLRIVERSICPLNDTEYIIIAFKHGTCIRVGKDHCFKGIKYHTSYGCCDNTTMFYI